MIIEIGPNLMGLIKAACVGGIAVVFVILLIISI